MENQSVRERVLRVTGNEKGFDLPPSSNQWWNYV